MAGAALNSCPFCGKAIKTVVPGSGEINCAPCSRRSWFLADRSGNAWFFTNEVELDQIVVALVEQGGMSDFDYLDIVELKMELEERLPEL